MNIGKRHDFILRECGTNDSLRYGIQQIINYNSTAL